MLKKNFLYKKNIKATKFIIINKIFNWINNIINNKWKNIICLDIFSGKGNFTFKCISKFIKYVIIIENNKKNILNLLKIIKILNIKNYKILNNNIFYNIKYSHIYFNINLIFIDAPFKSNILYKILYFYNNIINLIKINTILYIESKINIKKKYIFLNIFWDFIKIDKIGNVNIFILKKKNP